MSECYRLRRKFAPGTDDAICIVCSTRVGDHADGTCPAHRQDFKAPGRCVHCGEPTSTHPERETIVAAAIRVPSSVVEGYAPYHVILSVPRPGRHHHVAWWLGEHAGYVDERDQGFLTNSGRFVDREEGCRIARAAGQLDGRTKTGGEDTLFSEDVW